MLVILSSTILERKNASIRTIGKTITTKKALLEQLKQIGNEGSEVLVLLSK